eukprot:CAMPEP_0184395944 /NCGR_PEP_ID=MMETSP0007-20130409/46657_1 /TAXON_ID=97485 /ORGANISM="Prymnesium parvum, Strain Texoma1" /LENGTH=74 /DNA_ID=CAMNT_0026748453 /DNA_START=211 /DNA_END=435 /DNA_ORIENTATION=+
MRYATSSREVSEVKQENQIRRHAVGIGQRKPSLAKSAYSSVESTTYGTVAAATLGGGDGRLAGGFDSFEVTGDT